MKKLLLLLLFATTCGLLPAQIDLLQSAKSLRPTEEFDNVHVQALYSDPFSSSFVIWIKEGVRLHQHVVHTEHVYILSGRADMRLGDRNQTVRKGDIIAIPPGTPHAVKVRGGTLKVLSIQSPEFKGKDRIYLED